MAFPENVNGNNFQADSGATITGTVYESDGITPITGKLMYVNAIQGNPCGSLSFYGSSTFNQTNGTYTINGLPEGSYYLVAGSSNSNYQSEWWADSGSTSNCSGAQSIAASPGQTITEKNFQLGPKATISGTLFESDGVTPITGKSMNVIAWQGDPCGSRTSSWSASINQTNGTYTIIGPPEGSYYLQPQGSNYVAEWWAHPSSTPNCSDAQAISVSPSQTITGKNFQLDLGATISGTLFESDGVTPITGKSMYVSAYQGDPCGSYRFYVSTPVNEYNGTYTFNGLPMGSYYLRPFSISNANYVAEWWADSGSTPNCSGAQAIAVSPGQTITGKNFQLDPGAAISGTLFESDGVTPIIGKYMYVYAYQGDPCGSRSSYGSVFFNQNNGAYTINGLPEGSYYLQARSGSNANYVAEWWADSGSTPNCSGAQALAASAGQNITGKNFQLELGFGISGTVFKTDGVTPITDNSVAVAVYSGAPCNNPTWIVGYYINSSNGTYTLPGLPVGTCYIRAYSVSDKFISEWWASPLSVQDCGAAQPIVGEAEQTHSGKNFQLEENVPVKKGDVNNDGNVDLTDLILVLRLLSGDGTVSVDIRADVNGDGKIGNAECIYIMQQVVGI
ncbi:MAG: dockerin type I domain-containing protein [Desulfatirhabdiaceae bacterium]